MWLDILGLCAGLFCMWQGSDLTVNGAKGLADRLDVSHTVIGLTILSFGTSLPEILTSVYAGYQISQGVETSGVAVGTVIGSEVVQITLILGVAALIGKMQLERRTLLRDGAMLLVALAGTAFCGSDGRISRIEGATLAVLYLIYLAWLARGQAKAPEPPSEPELEKVSHQHHTGRDVARVLGGLVVLLIGGKLVVDDAVALATHLGVSQLLVGTLIVGVGTSLPELFIALVAIRRRAEELSLGALIGSNITDPMLSMGSGASVAGFDFEKELYSFEVPFWLAATLIALGLLARRKGIGPSNRAHGVLLISLFAVFVTVKLWRA